MGVIVIRQHEGVISDFIDAVVDGKEFCLKNVKATWKWIEETFQRGATVRVERTMWDGSVKTEAWVDCPARKCRFRN
jgi:hypothetical protein